MHQWLLIFAVIGAFTTMLLYLHFQWSFTICYLLQYSTDSKTFRKSDISRQNNGNETISVKFILRNTWHSSFVVIKLNSSSSILLVRSVFSSLCDTNVINWHYVSFFSVFFFSWAGGDLRLKSVKSMSRADLSLFFQYCAYGDRKSVV